MNSPVINPETVNDFEENEFKDLYSHNDHAEAERAWNFIQCIVHGPCPSLESILAQDAEYAYWYAKIYLHQRFIAAEAVIRLEPEWAFRYARDIIQGRWPEAEPAIQQNQDIAARYAIYVLKDSWREAGVILSHNGLGATLIRTGKPPRTRIYMPRRPLFNP